MKKPSAHASVTPDAPHSWTDMKAPFNQADRLCHVDDVSPARYAPSEPAGLQPLAPLVKRPQDMPATRLIPHAQGQPEDDRILGIIASLPRVSKEGDRVLAGICNRVGMVYREVELEGTLDYIIFAARMNAAGYAHEAGVPARKGEYAVVFHKVGRRPPGC